MDCSAGNVNLYRLDSFVAVRDFNHASGDQDGQIGVNRIVISPDIQCSPADLDRPGCRDSVIPCNFLTISSDILANCA